MNKLFIIYDEIYTSGYMPEVLTVISTFVVLCGVLVIISKNSIISVLFLIGLFSGIASYLIISGLSFIGLSYMATVRVISKLVKLTHDSCNREERMAHPDRSDNLSYRKVRETIACHVKWMDAGAFDYLNKIPQETILAQGFHLG